MEKKKETTRKMSTKKGKGKSAMFYFLCNNHGSYQIIVSLYRLLCVITAKLWDKVCPYIKLIKLTQAEQH